MKLYLNSNLAEGTPEELVTYKELLKERGLDSEKSLFHFGHMHQLTEEEKQDTFKGFFGSLKLDKSSIGSDESSTDEAEDDKEEEEDSIYDKGAFYTVTEEASESALPVGAILQHLHGRIFIDSKGQQCIISRPSFVDRGSTHEFDDSIKQGRFELAKELSIQLTSTTDFAVEASDRTFKFKEDDGVFNKGELVKIVRDDNDRLPLVQSVEDSDKEDFAYIGKLKLVEDTFKGFFGSLKLDKSSIGSEESSTDEAETPSRDLKEGDRVKVLNSLGGAEGEATVTAVLEGGRVELAGNNKEGSYLSDWSNYISNVEKIKERPASFGAIQAKAYLEDKSIEQVVEEVQSKYKQESDNESVEEEIYDYYEVVDPGLFASSVEKGTVFKVIGNTYTLLNQEGKDRDYINVVTSTGLTQTSPLRDSVIKPIIDNSFIAGRFKFAKEVGINLSVDTDFEEECKDHHFKVTKDEYLSTFNPTDTLTVRRDDNTNAIAFQDLNGKAQYTLLKYVKEVARPSK